MPTPQIYYHIVYRVENRFKESGFVWDSLVRVGNILYDDKDKLLAEQQITYLAWKHKCPKSYYRIVRVRWQRGEKYLKWPKMYTTQKMLEAADKELAEGSYPKHYHELLTGYKKVQDE